jgi:hypothetical protein
METMVQRLGAINRENGSVFNALITYRECHHGKLISHKRYARKFWFEEESVIGLNILNFFQRHLLARLFYPVIHEKTPNISNYGLTAYGGLLFDKRLCAEIGYPNRDYILYYDDIEYTNRILAAGGHIYLGLDQVMEDIVPNYSNNMMSTPFLGVIKADSDSKVYYQVRNQIHFEYRHVARYKLLFLVNVAVYAAVSWCLALACLRPGRSIVILTAIYHAITDRLGLNDRYLLESKPARQ